MTNAELAEVIGLISSPDDLVSKLQESSFDDLPQWTDLEKQYDPQLHSIITDLITYPPKLNDKGQDEFKRTSFALQKLAVNRLVQSMFATFVQRQYDYDKDNESEQLAVDILENIYKTRNKIDKENIERGKKLDIYGHFIGTVIVSYSKVCIIIPLIGWLINLNLSKLKGN